ncbi:hypothetical protein C7476_105207 [Phyllobacterium bourgognense]|uniref:Uncharacterized protein n=1 Tax=Phyllobacterium bourgognense TaxID=314236 RepID=A0A368YU56_9HYPH|nr:hypothetical protein C7476_105207 [Phyllobacterium bourgognense]
MAAGQDSEIAPISHASLLGIFEMPNKHWASAAPYHNCGLVILAGWREFNASKWLVLA